MAEIDIVGAVSSIGFPITVSVYLLTKFSTQIERLSEQVGRLATTIDQFCNINVGRH